MSKHLGIYFFILLFSLMIRWCFFLPLVYPSNHQNPFLFWTASEIFKSFVLSVEFYLTSIPVLACFFGPASPSRVLLYLIICCHPCIHALQAPANAPGGGLPTAGVSLRARVSAIPGRSPTNGMTLKCETNGDRKSTPLSIAPARL